MSVCHLLLGEVLEFVHRDRGIVFFEDLTAAVMDSDVLGGQVAIVVANPSLSNKRWVDVMLPSGRLVGVRPSYLAKLDSQLLPDNAK